MSVLSKALCYARQLCRRGKRGKHNTTKIQLLHGLSLDRQPHNYHRQNLFTNPFSTSSNTIDMSTTNFICVNWGEQHFERLHLILVDFTPEFLNINRKRTKSSIRQEVDWHWEEQVMKSYPNSDDKMRIFLLEQVRCQCFQPEHVQDFDDPL